MRQFLLNNREDLIARCKAKVAKRPRRAATAAQLANGVPMFLDQIVRTLGAEMQGNTCESIRISGSSSGDMAALSEIGVSAAAHGGELMRLGFTVDAVVHGYGDLCQAITDLAVECDAPFTIDEFRTLNRCLDNAIADAVSEFGAQRAAGEASARATDENERMGVLVHELRNVLQTATLAFQALELGLLPVGGATGGLVARSHASMAAMLGDSMAQVRGAAHATADEVFSVAELVADAARAAGYDAASRSCAFNVAEVDPFLGVSGSRATILAALANILQNAFKFTHPRTAVGLVTRADGKRIFIEVSDHCGGLPHGATEAMFRPFTQSGEDRSGLGLGLSIARRGVEADGGTLTARDVPGAGCVFTIELPQRALH
ncbi:MAG: HAMP domain-containing histidine kinase [Caulobacter sp.]|nr:HAMP domain-containing histidine kinase [Vitreoscilla sp.]